MDKKALLINNTLTSPMAVGLLNGAGFGVDVVPDFEAASRQMDMNDYDIVLVMECSNSESWPICEQIKRTTTTPLIVISNNTSPDICARALYAGADYYMRKPFGPLEFLARVNSLLQRYSLRQPVPVG